MSVTESTDWSQLSLTDLCDHIEQTHHRYLTTALPRAGLLLDQLIASYGDRKPELYRLREVYTGMADDLRSHLPKEEDAVFSMIRLIEAGKARPGSLPFASVTYPIKPMVSEHKATSRDLDELERLIADHATAPAVDDDYQTVISLLEAIIADTRLHIHKENDVLFPRAIEREIRGR